MIKGSDPELSKEAIIIGAHLDGLGKCYEIMPGANDNASAVAVMMGIAKALGESRIPLKRSVMFIAFGSEEQALIGSKTYLENPLMPPGKSVLINLDGVGTGSSIGANAGKELSRCCGHSSRMPIMNSFTGNLQQIISIIWAGRDLMPQGFYVQEYLL